jgi:hypothetical protein
MPRFFVALACVAMFGSFGVAQAAPSPSPSPHAASDDVDAAPRAKDAGTIDGEVTAIDYRAGSMTVMAGSRRIDIVVLPSTNISGNDNFHTIADIKKGSHVSVILSQRAGIYTAQIIRLQ